MVVFVEAVALVAVVLRQEYMVALDCDHCLGTDYEWGNIEGERNSEMVQRKKISPCKRDNKDLDEGFVWTGICFYFRSPCQ